MTQFRVGQGIDIHPFTVLEKPFVLGGVKVDNVRGLQGHSDADALSHAICDALLGALGLGDIGQHFSDTDSKHKNRSSLEFLSEVLKMISSKGWKISNVDSTVMTETPMLNKHVPQMQKNIAEALGVDPDQISIKATRAEKLGSIGRKEGLVAMASCLLCK